MFCPKCGKEIPEGTILCQHCSSDLERDAKKTCTSCEYENDPNAAFCEKCGLNIASPATTQQPQYIPPPPLFEYAGFWRRFVALIIDGIIMYTILYIPVIYFFGALTSFSSYLDTSIDTADPVVMIGIFFCMLVDIVILWLYYALMESSSIQGTLGKKAIGIVVTDLDGNRISFGRATGRFLGKYLSGLFLSIGYILAGITEKKQALHDMLAGCLVIMKR